MKVTTRLIRNLSFVILVAVVFVAKQESALAVVCGPYWCGSACDMAGGYFSGRGCDGPCEPASAGCGGVDMSCNELCIWCNEQQGWVCGPIGSGLAQPGNDAGPGAFR